MKFSKSIAAVSLAALLITTISCSGLSETAGGVRSGAMSSGVYPQWYNASQTVVADSTGYRAYATAVAGDSVAAIQKANIHAEIELQTGLSRRLESIRNKLTGEPGNHAVLDTPGFIRALREAEEEAAAAVQTAHTAAELNADSGSGYRGFAGVRASKTALIGKLNRAFEGKYEKAWNVMKESQAFSGF